MHHVPGKVNVDYIRNEKRVVVVDIELTKFVNKIQVEVEIIQ